MHFAIKCLVCSAIQTWVLKGKYCFFFQNHGPKNLKLPMWQPNRRVWIFFRLLVVDVTKPSVPLSTGILLRELNEDNKIQIARHRPPIPEMKATLSVLACFTDNFSRDFYFQHINADISKSRNLDLDPTGSSLGALLPIVSNVVFF